MPQTHTDVHRHERFEGSKLKAERRKLKAESSKLKAKMQSSKLKVESKIGRIPQF